LVGGYGPDVEFIDQALKQMFDRLPVDARRLAVTGFSKGASYVLSVGLPDGDLFTHVIAFSPGFASPAAYRGKPPVFVSHGTRDEVLPIDRCSRRSSPSSSVQATRYATRSLRALIPYRNASYARHWNGLPSGSLIGIEKRERAIVHGNLEYEGAIEWGKSAPYARGDKHYLITGRGLKML
jgi:hypothetical protein